MNAKLTRLRIRLEDKNHGGIRAHHREFLLAFACAPFAVQSGTAAAPDKIVSKSPSCGCRSAWTEHAASFEVKANDMSQELLWKLKPRPGISTRHATHHTARTDRCFVVDQVPASDIRRLIAERPDGLGITVSGIPVGSPGMETEARRDRFDTLLFRRTGAAEILAYHE